MTASLTPNPSPAPDTRRLSSRAARRLHRGEEGCWSPAERFVLREVVAERDRLRQQLELVSDLSNRLIDTCDEKERHLELLTAQLREKDELIAALEEENRAVIQHLSTRESRISALESFLELIAQADRRG